MLAPTPNDSFFFFNDTATTEIYTLSLHDALPIFKGAGRFQSVKRQWINTQQRGALNDRNTLEEATPGKDRSEEHTSELQSQSNLVCRLLLEKKKIHRHRRPRDHAIHQSAASQNVY